MARSFGEPLTKLRTVPIVDNGEPLVNPRTLSKRIHFAAKHPKFEDMKCTPRVRKRVAEMLAQAAESLPDGIDIQIVEGFRSLAQQRFMYESLKAEFAQRHPEWNKATLHRVTNTMSAPPDDRCPPPHTTGGAVDLGLFDTAKGEQLDMTSPFDWDETSAPTQMQGLSAGPLLPLRGGYECKGLGGWVCARGGFARNVPITCQRYHYGINTAPTAGKRPHSTHYEIDI